LEVSSSVVTKPIYIVGHISHSTKVKFPVTIGVGVIKSVMFRWWLSKDVRKTRFSFYPIGEFSRTKIFVVRDNVKPSFYLCSNLKKVAPNQLGLGLAHREPKTLICCNTLVSLTFRKHSFSRSPYFPTESSVRVWFPILSKQAQALPLHVSCF